LFSHCLSSSSTTAHHVHSSDTTLQAIKSYGAALQAAEGRLADLLRLRSDVESVTQTAAALEPIDAAIAAAREAVAYVQAEVPQENMFEEMRVVVAYPNPHTIWDQIAVPPAVGTMRALVDFFATAHGLTVDQWSVQIKTEKGDKPRSTTLYPVEKPLDAALLPAYTAGTAQATREIMLNKGIREKQRYIQAYKELHSKGPDAFAKFLATPPAAVSDEDQPLRTLIEQRTGLDLTHRKRLLLDGLTLVDADGVVVDTAKIVYHLV
jgi:hypothetical protein